MNTERTQLNEEIELLEKKREQMIKEQIDIKRFIRNARIEDRLYDADNLEGKHEVLNDELRNIEFDIAQKKLISDALYNIEYHRNRLKENENKIKVLRTLKK